MSETIECTMCRQPVPAKECDADDRCEVCQALMKLRDTLIRTGKMKPETPELFREADIR